MTGTAVPSTSPRIRSETAREADAQLASSARKLMDALVGKDATGGDATDVQTGIALSKLNDMFEELHGKGGAVASRQQVISSQIVICNEIMRDDGLYALKRMETSADKTLRSLAEKVLERAIPVIWAT